MRRIHGPLVRIRVAGGIDIGEYRQVGILKARGEFIEEIAGAAELVRLKDADDPSSPSSFCAGERSAAFRRVMRIIIIHRNTVYLTLLFPASIYAAEFLDALLGFLKGDTELKADGHCRQRILYVMLTGNLQCNISKFVLAAHDSKRCGIISMPQINRLNIGLWIQSIGNNFLFAQVRHDILERGLIQAQNDKSIERNSACELNKRPFDIFQIAIAVQVICFKGGQHSDSWCQRQK